MLSRVAAIAVCLGLATGCDLGEVSYDDFEYDTTGPWQLPPELAAIADAYFVDYDDAPPWDGGAHCTGSFSSGAAALADELGDRFPQVSDVGGYSCRPNTANTSKTSIHGTGRAIDVFIPLQFDADADNALGDPVANWLVDHAEELGVQFIIWDRSKWNGSHSAPKLKGYGGPHPHHDHLHVELTEAAAGL